MKIDLMKIFVSGCFNKSLTMSKLPFLTAILNDVKLEKNND